MQVKLDKTEMDSQQPREMLNPQNFTKAMTKGHQLPYLIQTAANQPKSTKLAGQGTTAFRSLNPEFAGIAKILVM